MTINKTETQNELTLSVSGYLDTATSPQLEAELKKSLDDKTSLILDLAGVEYMSSSGIRVLIYANKVMSSKGKMVVRNVQKSVLDVIEMVGLTDALTIE